ncbi:MAG: ATP synthase F1 subunit gamma [Clostridia bacterium]|nr:ATP synthase F1 subunit gamma [Clostridia bacterium]
MGASAKDVKIRIKSVESTQQITRAMGLVASSKLRRAKERMETSRAYFVAMRDTLGDIAAKMNGSKSLYITGRDVKKVCYVVIAGDRGLAGGYNNNVLRLLAEHIKGKNVCVVPVGKRVHEYCKTHGIEILTDEFSVVESIDRNESALLARRMAQSFSDGVFDELHLIYTHFNSMLSQAPSMMRLLPLEVPADVIHDIHFILYEPGITSVFEAVVPEYLTGILYGAIADSYCCELTARRNAMDAAGKNAEEMLEKLNLDYNRARQSAITQEITEIIAGSAN